MELILYADPITKKLMKFSESDSDHAVNLGDYSLEEIISKKWFQDNTEIFAELLNNTKSFVMCIYPPGSGKSTIAQLLKHYLDKDSSGMPERVGKFLDICKFQLMENNTLESDQLYDKFRHSAYVLFADFSNIKGRTRRELELNYTTYMQTCWTNVGLPMQLVDKECRELEVDQGCVWTSLFRLRCAVARIKGSLYVILDSVDHMI